MNIREMQRNFMIKLQQFVESPKVKSEDIEYYINRAQEEYTKTQYLTIRDNIRNEDVPSSQVQQSIENLRTLIRVTKKTYLILGDPQGGEMSDDSNISNAIFSSLHGDLEFDLFPYAFYLRSRLKIEDQNYVNCRIIDTNDINRYIATKYNKPLFREPAVIIENDIITVIYPADIQVVDNETEFILTYITLPKPVNITGDDHCLLPEHTHYEIVDIAVNLKLGDLQKFDRMRGVNENPEQSQQPPGQEQR